MVKSQHFLTKFGIIFLEGIMKIQKILYNLRETNGLTQQEIAEILGVDIKTYNRYEKGLHEIKLGVLLKLATYYNLSLDFLT